MKYWEFSNGDELNIKAIRKIGTAKYHNILENLNTQYPELASKILHYYPRQQVGSETDITLTYKDGNTEMLTLRRKQDDFFFFDIS